VDLDLGRMALAMEDDEALDPIALGLFRADAVMSTRILSLTRWSNGTGETAPIEQRLSAPQLPPGAVILRDFPAAAHMPFGQIQGTIQVEAPLPLEAHSRHTLR